ncbi:unnamed protein product, partial [Prunus brigantina]
VDVVNPWITNQLGRCGALKKKNAQESYDIFEMLGSNDQHKDTRGKSAGIYEISPNNELALQVAGLQRKLDSCSTWYLKFLKLKFVVSAMFKDTQLTCAQLGMIILHLSMNKPT